MTTAMVNQEGVPPELAPLADEWTIDEGKFTLREVTNGKAVALYDRSTELLELGVRKEPVILQSFHGIVTALWR